MTDPSVKAGLLSFRPAPSVERRILAERHAGRAEAEAKRKRVARRRTRSRIAKESRRRNS